MLEPAIFDLQKFWPEGDAKFQLTAASPGNKALLTAYAYMVLDLFESGGHASAKAYASDYLQLIPSDQMGVRQKAIDPATANNDHKEELRLLNDAGHPPAADNPMSS